MAVVKDSRLAVRLSSQQNALIRHAAEVEGTSITEFTVAAALLTDALDDDDGGVRRDDVLVA